MDKKIFFNYWDKEIMRGDIVFEIMNNRRRDSREKDDVVIFVECISVRFFLNKWEMYCG